MTKVRGVAGNKRNYKHNDSRQSPEKGSAGRGGGEVRSDRT